MRALVARRCFDAVELSESFMSGCTLRTVRIVAAYLQNLEAGAIGEPGCPIDTRSLLDGVKEDFQLVGGRKDGDRWRLVIGCDP